MSVFSFEYKSKTVHLIDTPGFDDSTRPEPEVLREVSYWLSKAYGKPEAKPDHRFLLNGIVYLHSIANVRWDGATRRSFNMLRTITGPENFDAIVLTTTFWDQVDRVTGAKREEQLMREKWAQLLPSGGGSKSAVRRHDKGYQSAISIIDSIMKRNKRYALLIQKELSAPGASLYDTTAGKEARIHWQKDVEDYQRKLRDAREDFEAQQDQSNSQAMEDAREFERIIAQRRNAISDLHLSKLVMEQRYETKNVHELQLLATSIAEVQASIISCQRAIQEMRNNSSMSLASSKTEVVKYNDQIEEQRRKEKALMVQKMAKLASRSMHAGVASALFGGASFSMAAVPAALHLAPAALAMCSVM